MQLNSHTRQYLIAAGLIEELPSLQLLAQRLVAQIHHRIGLYQPKRSSGRAPIASHGWCERLSNYEWPARVGFIEACSQVDGIESDLRELAIKIDRGQQLDMQEAAELQKVTRRIFEWGGVTRGSSKQSPKPDLIASVIASALRWERLDGAPMDAGWTKVAAFSTHWLEGSERVPQVIYDSRVSNALLRNVEKLSMGEHVDWVRGLLPMLRRHLRLVPGRGGSRKEPTSLRWKSGYGRWDAQFFASVLVALMRDALNDAPNKYGLMPRPALPPAAWTSRGVEMVLFMEGY